MSDELRRPGQFRRNGHQANLALCGLPEAVEQGNRGRFQQRVRMHSSLQMREEGSFQMYPQRSGAAMANLRPSAPILAANPPAIV